MDRTQLLELALEALEKQKATVSAEIDAIRTQLRGSGSAARKAKPAKARIGRRKPQTVAARKAQSQKMKKYWAEKRVAAKKKAVKRTTRAGKKSRAKTAAEKKALSLKMKEIWKKRKAEAAGKK
jgi:hypothetical protein